MGLGDTFVNFDYLNMALIAFRKGDSIWKRIANGTFWSLTSVALGKALVLIASVFCARILGDVGFGEFGIIRSTIGMFVVFGSASLGTTASKYIAEYRASSNMQGITKIYYLTNGFALILSVCFSILLFLSADFIAESNFHDPSLTIDIQIGTLLLLFSIINAAQNGVLSGFEKFKVIALNTLYSSILECIGIIVGAYIYGVHGAILGYGLSFIFWSIINYYSIRCTFIEYNCSRTYIPLNKCDYKILWKFSVPSTLNSIMVAPCFWIIKTLLIQKDGFSALGIYEAADQWKIIILFVPNAIANILMPIFSNVNSNENRVTYNRILNASIGLNGAIALVLVCFVFLFKDLIMSFYGKGFYNTEVLFVLCASTIFSSMAQVITLSLISRSKVWISFIFNFLWAVMMVCITYFLLENNYGVSALAYANFYAYILHFLFQFAYIKICLK